MIWYLARKSELKLSESEIKKKKKKMIIIKSIMNDWKKWIINAERTINENDIMQLKIDNWYNWECGTDLEIQNVNSIK